MTANPLTPELPRHDNPPPPALRHLQKPWVICILLALLTLIPYAQMLGQDFVNYDDDLFITRNPHIYRGLTSDAVQWAFGFQTQSQYHPLTTLSHALDCQLFGLNPAGPKAFNLLLHVATTVLIFRLLLMMTGSLWPSAIVAALCGIHPLRVEAVAWISERKEMLSDFFGVLTTISYVWYTRRRNIGRYLLMLLLYTLTLMSKPMLVTLPFVFLLLDYCPLRRFDLTPVLALPRKLWWLFVEKLPMFPLLIASSYLTWRVVEFSGAAHSLKATPIAFRLVNVLIAYCWYIYKTFVPLQLTCLYVFDPTWPIWKVALSATVFLSITYFALRNLRRRPYLAVGWFFFVGTMVPVIGLVQVGAQSYADRYSYVGQIGLFVMLAWGGADLLKRFRVAPNLVSILLAAVIAALVGVTAIQVTYWDNGKSLFTHALDVDSQNATAHNNLGSIYLVEGNLQRAAEEFFAATQIFSESPEAWSNLGNTLILKGDYGLAIEALDVAYKYRPDSKFVLTNLGIAYFAKKDMDRAIDYLGRAVQSDPYYSNARFYLAQALRQVGRLEEAQAHAEAVIQLQDTADAEVVLADILSQRGNQAGAMEAIKRALQLNPKSEKALTRLERLERGETTLDFSTSQPAATQPAGNPTTTQHAP